MTLARGTVENLALAEELARAEAQVRDGSPLAPALGQALPPLAIQLLDAGETSGALPALASRAADALDREVQQALTRAVSLVEPVMILGFGGIVGFVALALLQAIYGINARGL
jgi:type II secretory pathway component PulF